MNHDEHGVALPEQGGRGNYFCGANVREVDIGETTQPLEGWKKVYMEALHRYWELDTAPTPRYTNHTKNNAR